jgi:hypothetical protein
MLIYQRVYSFVWKYGTSNGTSKFSNKPLARQFSLYGQEITPGISKWSGCMEGHGSFIPGVHGLEHQAIGKDLWETLGKSLENHMDFSLPCPIDGWCFGANASTAAHTNLRQPSKKPVKILNANRLD